MSRKQISKTPAKSGMISLSAPEPEQGAGDVADGSGGNILNMFGDTPGNENTSSEADSDAGADAGTGAAEVKLAPTTDVPTSDDRAGTGSLVPAGVAPVADQNSENTKAQGPTISDQSVAAVVMDPAAVTANPDDEDHTGPDPTNGGNEPAMVASSSAGGDSIDTVEVSGGSAAGGAGDDANGVPTTVLDRAVPDAGSHAELDAPTTQTTLAAHPAAALFPMLDDDKLVELAEDIANHGQVEPVVTITDAEGRDLILDGRNRAAACEIAGVKPITIPWDGSGGTPVGFVLAKNIHRRHLSASQRAAIAVDLLPLLEAEARERRHDPMLTTQAADSSDGRAAVVVAALPPAASGTRAKSRDLAAAALGIGGRNVQNAKTISLKAPEVLAQVKAGSLSIPQARRIAAIPDAEDRKTAMDEAKTRKPGSKRPAAPTPEAKDPPADDVAGIVRDSVTALVELLDGIPKAKRAIWWAPLRAALKVVWA